MTVEIGDGTDYEPDASVYCGERAPPDAVVMISPTLFQTVVPAIVATLQLIATAPTR